MSKTLMEVYKAELSKEMQEEALQVALLAVNIYTEDNDISYYITKEFDRRHGRTWHCIVGNCGYYVQPNAYICFSAGDKRISLFRTD